MNFIRCCFFGEHPAPSLKANNQCLKSNRSQIGNHDDILGLPCIVATAEGGPDSSAAVGRSLDANTVAVDTTPVDTPSCAPPHRWSDYGSRPELETFLVHNIIHPSSFSKSALQSDNLNFDSSNSLGTQSNGILALFASSRQPKQRQDLPRASTLAQLISAISSASWIGQGAQGGVVKAQWRSGAPVAVKWLVTDAVNVPAAYMEALVAKMLAHPYLVQTFDCAMCQLGDDFSQVATRSPSSPSRTPNVADHPGASAFPDHQMDTVGALDSFEGTPSGAAAAQPVECVDVLKQLGAAPGKYVVQIVSEWCDEGTLHAAIRKGVFRAQGRRTRMWALRALLRTAREVALGMCHLHSLNIIHGDLKPGNVLLKSSRVDSRGFVAKVADFGLSRLCRQHEQYVETADWGTVPYMAGEYLDNKLCKSSDVYSFGVLLWQMFTGRAPFAGQLEAQVAVGVMMGDLQLEWPAQMPPPLLRLGQSCCRHEPDQRPTFKEIVVALTGMDAQLRELAARARHPPASAGGMHSQGGSITPGSITPGSITPFSQLAGANPGLFYLGCATSATAAAAVAAAPLAQHGIGQHGGGMARCNSMDPRYAGSGAAADAHVVAAPTPSAAQYGVRLERYGSLDPRTSTTTNSNGGTTAGESDTGGGAQRLRLLQSFFHSGFLVDHHGTPGMPPLPATGDERLQSQPYHQPQGSAQGQDQGHVQGQGQGGALRGGGDCPAVEPSGSTGADAAVCSSSATAIGFASPFDESTMAAVLSAGAAAAAAPPFAGGGDAAVMAAVAARLGHHDSGLGLGTVPARLIATAAAGVGCGSSGLWSGPGGPAHCSSGAFLSSDNAHAAVAAAHAAVAAAPPPPATTPCCCGVAAEFRPEGDYPASATGTAAAPLFPYHSQSPRAPGPPTFAVPTTMVTTAAVSLTQLPAPHGFAASHAEAAASPTATTTAFTTLTSSSSSRIAAAYPSPAAAYPSPAVGSPAAAVLAANSHSRVAMTAGAFRQTAVGVPDDVPSVTPGLPESPQTVVCRLTWSPQGQVGWPGGQGPGQWTGVRTGGYGHGDVQHRAAAPGTAAAAAAAAPAPLLGVNGLAPGPALGGEHGAGVDVAETTASCRSNAVAAATAKAAAAQFARGGSGSSDNGGAGGSGRVSITFPTDSGGAQQRLLRLPEPFALCGNSASGWAGATLRSSKEHERQPPPPVSTSASATAKSASPGAGGAATQHRAMPSGRSLVSGASAAAAATAAAAAAAATWGYGWSVQPGPPSGSAQGAVPTPLVGLRGASSRRASTGPVLQHVPEDDGDGGGADAGAEVEAAAVVAAPVSPAGGRAQKAKPGATGGEAAEAAPA